MNIEFSTGVWEKTIHFLESGELRRQFNKINYPFSKKTIYANNVNNRILVSSIAHDLYPDFELCFSEDNAGETLNHFGIIKASFFGGYYYSIQHLSKIYNTNSPYLFHISEDCDIINLDAGFFEEAVYIMETQKNIICAMPSWDETYEAPRLENIFEIGNFYCGLGFTDQVYFINTEHFKKPIYGYHHPASDRYPAYGGNCFEKRVDSYMQTFGYYKLTHKKSCYKHIR